MKLSIITINYNNAIGLEKTIKSLIEQSYQEYEYIVIDGASDDDSKAVILKIRAIFLLGVLKKILESIMP